MVRQLGSPMKNSRRREELKRLKRLASSFHGWFLLNDPIVSALTHLLLTIHEIFKKSTNCLGLQLMNRNVDVCDELDVPMVEMVNINIDEIPDGPIWPGNEICYGALLNADAETSAAIKKNLSLKVATSDVDVDSTVSVEPSTGVHKHSESSNGVNPSISSSWKGKLKQMKMI